MKRWYLILISCLVFSSLSGQVAILQDTEEYYSVRFQQNSKSKIIYNLKTDVAFFYSIDYYHDEESEWVKIFIPKNKYSLACNKEYLEGFVPKSKVKPLEELKTYNGTNFSFKLKDKPFDKEGKIMDALNDEIVFSINGLQPLGVNGNLMPSIEIDSINITLDGETIHVPQALTMDLFECKNNSKVYKVKNDYFVQVNCSSGTAYYEVIWVVNKDGIKQRLAGAFH